MDLAGKIRTWLGLAGGLIVAAAVLVPDMGWQQRLIAFGGSLGALALGAVAIRRPGDEPNARRPSRAPKAAKRSNVDKFIGLVLLALLPALMTMPACATTSPAREACYAKAHATLWEAAERECGPSGKDWQQCEHRQRLLDEHRAAQARCP